MCGIAGHVCTKFFDSSKISKMLDGIAHRGDRAPSCARFENVWLGCVRLAIVDREKNEQPASRSEDGLSLVFNGEIYNRCTLSKELNKDYVSEAHVILEAYKRWGTDFVTHLEGMFAILLYDAKEKVIHAIRDQFGIKPLYYLQYDDEIYFGSELKAMIAVLPKEVVAKNIREIMPGTVLSFSLTDQISHEKHFQTNYNISVPKTIEEACQKLRQLLRESIWSMLDTDLPIGVLCSGGIDSSAILYEVLEYKKQKNKFLDVTAYCVGTANPRKYPHPDSPDFIFADHVWRELTKDFPPNERRPMQFVEISEKKALQLIPDVIRSIETFEPNHIRAGTANLALMRKIQKDGIKIVLVGEGADELIGGYQEFAHCVLANGYSAELQELFSTFGSQLYKTQLKRVDRLSMACTIEARVPFLSPRISQFLSKLPNQWKVDCKGDCIITKRILREAYKKSPIKSVWNRRKVPMGEGAGVGDNRQGGSFSAFAARNFSRQQVAELMRKYANFSLNNEEEAWYFSQFISYFGPVEIAADRPITNILPTE